MRLVGILPLFVAFACGAQDASDITTKVFEPDRNKDGKPDLRVETVFRGKELVMVEWSKPNAEGGWSVTSRAFHAGGDMVAVEADEDGDGFLETLAVFRPGTEVMEVFVRQSDGKVQPVGAEALAAFRKQNAAISEFVQKAFDKDADPAKFGDWVREAQQKIRDAQTEKGDAGN